MNEILKMYYESELFLNDIDKVISQEDLIIENEYLAAMDYLLSLLSNEDYSFIRRKLTKYEITIKKFSLTLGFEYACNLKTLVGGVKND